MVPLKWKREAANAQKKQQNEKLAAAEMTSSAGRKGGGVDTGPKGWVASGKFYESILLKPGVCALGALHEQFCKLFESVTVHTPVHMRGVLQRVVPEVGRSRGRSLHFLPCYYDTEGLKDRHEGASYALSICTSEVDGYACGLAAQLHAHYTIK